MEKAVALFCVFGLGMCFSLLGSVSVKLMPRLNIDQGRFGSLVSVFMGSCLVGSLVLGTVIDRLGYKPVAVFGFLLTAACLLLLAQSRTYTAALACCLLLGLGAMALNIAGNTPIPVVLFDGKNPAAASNLGNVFFGVGLLLTPLLTSLLFRVTSYAKAISAVALVILAPVGVAAIATYPTSNTTFELVVTSQ